MISFITGTRSVTSLWIYRCHTKHVFLSYELHLDKLNAQHQNGTVSHTPQGKKLVENVFTLHHGMHFMMTSSNGNIFPRYWPSVRGIHRSPVNSSHKGQWRGALMFSLICVWINDWVNNRETGDLRRYRVHYDVTVMIYHAWLIAPWGRHMTS